MSQQNEVYVDLLEEILNLAEDDKSVLDNSNSFIDFVESYLPANILLEVRKEIII